MATIKLAICAGAGKDSTGHAQKGGVHLLEIDPATGHSREIAANLGVPNPSYLAWSERMSVLYVASEIPEVDGWITALKLAGDTFTALGDADTGGNSAVHLCLDRTGNFIFVANYQDKEPTDQISVAAFALNADGTLGAMTGSATHAGHGKDPKRQERPHCHGVAISPDNRLLAAIDLGTDGVYFYRFDAATGALSLTRQFTLPAGSGPRHPVFHPTRPLIYVASELDSTLKTVAFGDDAHNAELLASEPSTRETGDFRNYPSGIAISPDGRFVLMANRGADTIGVFFIDPHTGVAKLKDEVPCGGRFPRAIRLDPTGRVLAVANQKSDNVSLFGWDFAAGKLSPHPIADIKMPIAYDAIFIAS